MFQPNENIMIKMHLFNPETHVAYCMYYDFLSYSNTFNAEAVGVLIPSD